MRIFICDDEEEVRDWLKTKVQKFCPEAQVVCFGSGEELLAAGMQADLLFLDIKMPGMDGMELARQLRKKKEDMILIFVTGLEEYVFEAFDVHAFHYLVKPCPEEKFAEVLKSAVVQYQGLAEGGKVQEKPYILVKTGGVSTKVYKEHIIYAEVFNRKVILHKTDGDMEYYGRLSDLQNQLGEDFFRTHRAYLIHFPYVEKYNATTVFLEKGTALMAKKHYPEFVKQYLKYNQRKGNNGK